MAVIQNIILPEPALQTPPNMYFRLDKADFDKTDALESKSRYNYQDKILTLAPDKKYYFNTYYNGLSVNIWKQNCRLDRLGLKLRGHGRVQVEIMLMTQEFDTGRKAKTLLIHRLLAQKSVMLTPEGSPLAIEDWPHVTDGMLYITLRAEDNHDKPAEFYGGCFETADRPQHNIRLGLVITHFNRKNYVLPAMRRLKWDILDHPYYSRFIDIAIVDNSRTITGEEADGITLLPSANYGGAGGFARGLLHFKDSGFSHCLFMDDDASCETEAVYRTLSLLQYARFDNLAVSGAMLRECGPCHLWAKGEYFKKLSISNPRHGLDMREAANLLRAEEDSITASKYGGFWHFAFPIARTDYYPFPFFVRGDDMLFCLMNDFRIITLNGIGNFADDFSSKESPFICYLGVRGTFLSNIIARPDNVRFYIKKYKKMLRAQLYAYNYSHARACSLAMQDLLKGVKFWADNMDITEIRRKLAKQANGEIIRYLENPAQGQMRPYKKEKPLHKLLRKLTLQGFLLPRFMIKKHTVLIPKNFAGRPAASFRRDTVFYYMQNPAHGYYADYDRKRFFTEWWLSRKIRFQMAWRLKHVIADYKTGWHSLASEKFWRKIYTDKENSNPF